MVNSNPHKLEPPLRRHFITVIAVSMSVLVACLALELASWSLDRDFPFVGLAFLCAVGAGFGYAGLKGRLIYSLAERVDPAAECTHGRSPDCADSVTTKPPIKGADHFSLYVEEVPPGWATASYVSEPSHRSAPVTTWQEAEHSAMHFMRAHGHPDAKLTPPGPDGGVDVVAFGAIAQVKFRSAPVGEPAVVQLAGTKMRPQHIGRSALFFSTGGYTPKALSAARELGVELYVLGNGRHWTRAR